MIYKRWKLCITATMLLLCGCSQREDSALTPVNDSQQTEQQPEQQPETESVREPEESVTKAEKIEETKNTFPQITVIDALPAVDETIPREPTKLPSSEVIMIVGDKEKELHIKQEDGTFLDEWFSVYNVICRDHDVSFAMPEDGQIIWRGGSGVSVQYIGEREHEILRELEDKELTLELICAERTDRMEDSTSWWELDYSLIVELEDGSRLTLATMDISKVFLVQGVDNIWDDAHYRIWGYPYAMWELLEEPEEDKGETFLTVLLDGTFTDEASIYDYMEQYAEERQITWECSREKSFWYDYLIWNGESSEYQYRVAVPVMNEDAGSWMILAEIKKGAENPEDCWSALSVFMQTFHANPYFYDVKEGDTLYEIAKTYLDNGESYLRLANINGLADPDFIYEGQLLKIPVEK